MPRRVGYTYPSQLNIKRQQVFRFHAAIRVSRNGTCEPGQGRNTAAISRPSHVPRGCLDGSMKTKDFFYAYFS